MFSRYSYMVLEKFIWIKSVWTADTSNEVNVNVVLLKKPRLN